MLRALNLGPIPWGWKDPRNSVTLPIWLSLFPQAKVIHVVRNGIDVSISLHQREVSRKESSHDYERRCLDYRYCFHLWEQYLEACSFNTAELPPVRYLKLEYEAILREPERSLISVLHFLSHSVREKTLKKVAGSVDQSRIGNTQLRLQYAQEIADLPPSQLMVELGYA
jgi:hypothetical protein